MGVLFHAFSFYMGASFSSQTWNVRIPILSQGLEGVGRSKKRRKGGGGGRKVDDKMGKLQNEERAEERMFGEVDACLSPQAYIQEGHATPRMFSKFVCG